MSAVARLRALLAAEPIFAAAGLFMLLLCAPLLAAAGLDGRTLNGINIWIKPLKFAASLSLYLLTLAAVATLLRPGFLRSGAYRAYAGVVLAAIAFEMMMIVGAAALGTASHYNTATPLAARLYQAMGALAVVLTTASAVYAAALYRAGPGRTWPVLHDGLVLGLALVLPLTLVTAFALGGNGGHWVGGTRSDTGGLMLFGWSRDGGDLRVAHFFATHAMHFIPAAALAAALLLGPTRRWPAWAAAAALVALVAFTFAQALQGRPFLA
jgi:hypothetical protein